MIIWPFGGSHNPSVEAHDEAGIRLDAATARAVTLQRALADQLAGFTGAPPPEIAEWLAAREGAAA